MLSRKRSLRQYRMRIQVCDTHWNLLLLPTQTSTSELIGATIKDIEAKVGNNEWQAVKRQAIRLKYLDGIQDAVYARLAE